MLVTSLHPTDMQQPGDPELRDPALTAGSAEPRSAGEAAVLVTSQQTLPSSRQGLPREGQGAQPREAAGRVPGHPRAGVLSTAARELRSQNLQQDHRGGAAQRLAHRDAHSLTHRDAHPRVTPCHPRCRVVGEATACSWGSAVGLQRGGLADWSHSPHGGDVTTGGGQESWLLQGRRGPAPHTAGLGWGPPCLGDDRGVQGDAPRTEAAECPGGSRPAKAEAGRAQRGLPSAAARTPGLPGEPPREATGPAARSGEGPAGVPPPPRSPPRDRREGAARGRHSP